MKTAPTARVQYVFCGGFTSASRVIRARTRPMAGSWLPQQCAVELGNRRRHRLLRKRRSKPRMRGGAESDPHCGISGKHRHRGRRRLDIPGRDQYALLTIPDEIAAAGHVRGHDRPPASRRLDQGPRHALAIVRQEESGMMLAPDSRHVLRMSVPMNAWLRRPTPEVMPPESSCGWMNRACRTSAIRRAFRAHGRGGPPRRPRRCLCARSCATRRQI